MKLITFLSLLILVTNHVRTIPKYTVDLDDMSTYDKVLKGKEEALRVFLKNSNPFNAKPSTEMQKVLDNLTPKVFVEKYGKLARTLVYSADYFGIPFQELANKFLESNWACFGAVVEDPSGELWLLRNLDQTANRSYQELIVDIDFYEKGKLVYSGIQAVGVGVLLNATRKGEYTASVNTGKFSTEWKSTPRLLDGAYATTAILNVVIQNAKTFQEAVRLIEKTKWSNRMLVILAGNRPEEKAIIQLGGDVMKIKTTKGKLISIENKAVTEFEQKSEAIKEKIASLQNYSHVELIKLIQQRPIWTSINTFTSVTKVSNGVTYAEFSEGK